MSKEHGGIQRIYDEIDIITIFYIGTVTKGLII